MYIPANFDWKNPPKKKQSLFVRLLTLFSNQKRKENV